MNEYYAVLNTNDKLAGLLDVLTLADMGRRAVVTGCDRYDTVALRRGRVAAPNWSDPSTRARLMPRDRWGRFVALKDLEEVVQEAVQQSTGCRPDPLLYLPAPWWLREDGGWTLAT